MNESTVLSIFAWLGNHPVLFGFFIFFIALIESLAIVGIIVPGIVLMLIIGAYLASDQFSFSIAVLLTFTGAVAGDSISYYLGSRYKNKLINLWPISRYPETFKKGIRFFERHGNKSIILGRFIGPLRPLIPAIAGMFQMPRKQFFVSNIFSALIWAPVILLPGYIIGLSVDFASDIAGNLILLVIIVGSLLWFIFWLVKSFYLYLLPRFENAVVLLLNWSHKHPLPGVVASTLLEKKYPDKNIFVILFFLYIIFSGVFFALPVFLGVFESTSDIDIFLKNVFLTFNSPLSNQFVANILNLINISWLLFLSGFILLVIIWKKHAILLRYYIFTLVLISLVQIILNKYINIDQSNNLSAVSTYLFLTFVLTFNSTLRRKILYYGVCYTLISSIIVSEIYYDRSNITPLILTSLFSLLWIVILTSTYRHHSDSHKFTHQFQRRIGLVFISIIIFNIIFVPVSFPLKTSHTNNIIVENSTWVNYTWKNLPSNRKGFINKTKQAFNIQWAGTRQEIIKKLTTNQTSNAISNSNKITWTLSEFPQVSEVLQFLNSQANINALAIFPHLHSGAYEQLRFTHVYKNKDGLNEIMTLRLWKINFRIKKFNPDNQAKPLWLGSLEKLVMVKRAGVKLLRSRLINEKQLHKFASDFNQVKNEVILKHNKIKKLAILLIFLN